MDVIVRNLKYFSLENIPQELKDTADTHFRFLNKVEPAEYATQLAENMHKYPPEDVLSGGELLFQMYALKFMWNYSSFLFNRVSMHA